MGGGQVAREFQSQEKPLSLEDLSFRDDDGVSG